MLSLEEIVRARVSIRRFRPDPIPREVLERCLSLAQRAPSNSNIQPWRLFLAEGQRKTQLSEALLREHQNTPREAAPLPPSFQANRRELGAMVYGAMGIAREDKTARAAAVLRNYEFFGAPLVGIVCLHHDLGLVDAVGVGMYLQTLLLALSEVGIGSCVQAALATYPEVLRRELQIPNELTILCGVALGFADPDFAANQLHVPRQPIENNVTFLL